MGLWSVIARRVLPFGGSLSEEARERLRHVAALDETEMIKALEGLQPVELRELARIVLRERVTDAIEVLRDCAPCRELLSDGGYDPIELLETFRHNIGRWGAQMDIDESGLGGMQRGQGFDTRIRFGPREFLTGVSLGLTLRESQIQVVLHELAHAAGDVIPPDGHSAEESVRNQERIARACLPEAYKRMKGQESEAVVKSLT
jgi:hypothetical protein